MQWQTQIDWGDVVATAALLVSIVVSVVSYRLSKAQVVLTQEQRRLNKLLLAKAESEAQGAAKASLSASLIKVGDNYRVRVFNRGPATATDVNVIVPSGAHVLSTTFVAQKFPMEVMEQGQSVDIHAMVYLGMGASKFPLTLTWSDDSGTDNRKEIFITL